ncbi:hypothetical protein ABBQ32_008709 [Trebouxia sp. C0010 RCD-2024]
MKSWWEVLTPGGAMLGDDSNDDWPGVKQAVQEFSINQGMQFTVEYPKRVIREPLNPFSDPYDDKQILR